MSATPKIASAVNRVFSLILVAVLVFSPLAPVQQASAAASITVSPLTWNVIGLDSNDVTTGPNHFPVGARVCNTGSTGTSNVSVDFVWDSANALINIRPGSLETITIPTLAAGDCSDAYFEVEVGRNMAAYDTTRRYHITATDSSGTVSTPTPRELYVEHLISQNRNTISDVKLDGVSIVAGGSMDLMVGNTYTIDLIGGTATQGYNQLEDFINFPNTIFQVLSVSTSYSADNSPYVPDPNDSLYADACGWENDPNNPNYLSCVGGDYKSGGSNVTTTYVIKVIAGAGNSQPLNSLLYDFSGSSFHYNSDFSVSARIANIFGPSSVTIAKTFTPKAVTPPAASVLMFKLTNPLAESFSGVQFTDSLPAGMVVSTPPEVVTNGCGGGAFSPALAGGETSLSFSNATLSPNSVCTIAVKVQVTAAGAYANTTGHLFIESSIDTGNTGSDTLTATSAAACLANQTLVTWTFPAGTTLTQPNYNSKAADVNSATLSFNPGATGGSEAIDAANGSPSPGSWMGSGFLRDTVYTAYTEPWFDISVDTSMYSNVSIQFRTYASASWTTNNVLRVLVQRGWRGQLLAGCAWHGDAGQNNLERRGSILWRGSHGRQHHLPDQCRRCQSFRPGDEPR